MITEDSATGFQFFYHVCNENYITCISAVGKSNIFAQVQKQNAESVVLVIADGAAFGPEMEKMMSLLRIQKKLYLYLPESFEGLILKSGVVKASGLEKVLSETYNYVESSKYASWEQFFTALLIEKTKDTYLAYTKRTLNDAYVGGSVKRNILAQMDGITFRIESEK